MRSEKARDSVCMELLCANYCDKLQVLRHEGRHVNIEDLPERERKRAEAERKAKIEEEVWPSIWDFLKFSN